MTHRFFTVSALDASAGELALNQFCASHRVLTIERHFVAAGVQSFWAICVVAIDGEAPLPGSLKDGASRRGAVARIDYREVLQADAFTVFAALRNWRNALADAEHVPRFVLLTNEQMAEVARRRPSTLQALGAIDGIGAARLERIGAAVLEQVRNAAAGISPESPSQP